MHTLERAKLIYSLYIAYMNVVNKKASSIPSELAFDCIAEEIDPRVVITLFMQGYRPQDIVIEIEPREFPIDDVEDDLYTPHRTFYVEDDTPEDDECICSELKGHKLDECVVAKRVTNLLNEMLN